MWFTEVPMVPPLGTCSLNSICTPGILTTATGTGPRLPASTPPSASTQNFFCASMLLV